MHKLIRTSLLAAAATLVCSGAVQAAELVQNAGFETGDLSDWDVFDNGGSIAVSTDNPSSGVYSANLIADGGPNNPLIKNSNIGIGQVSGGDMVTISVDIGARQTPGPLDG